MRAREYAAKSGASVEWVEQDMRNFVGPPALIWPAVSLLPLDTLKMSRMIFACCEHSSKPEK